MTLSHLEEALVAKIAARFGLDVMAVRRCAQEPPRPPQSLLQSSQPPDHRVFTPEVPLPPAAGPAAPTTPGVPRHAAAAPGASPRLDISVSALCF